MNGNSAANIQSSNAIDYSLFDENNNEIAVNNVPNKIQFVIEKTINQSESEYQLINATQMNTTGTNFVNYTFTITSNVSIHVQIRPDDLNSSIGYLAMLKFGEIPNVTLFDLWDFFCPSGKFLKY
jgi:hypothetical protein